MKKNIIKRVLEETKMILETKKTIREIASYYGVSKSTVHKDLHERLREISEKEFEKVRMIMMEHIDIRHIRGGESTKRKYEFKK